jgi:sulfide:quinone oxidoreductase
MTAERGRPRVLIAGGGVAAIEALLALRDLAEDRLDLELLAPTREFVYRPLAVAAPFDLGESPRFDVLAIAEEQGASFRKDALAEVDADGQLLRTASGAEIEYDALLVATGVEAHEAIPGAITYRGPADNDSVRRLLEELERGDVREVVFAVPGGVAWALPLYELALLTARRLFTAGVEGTSLTLVTPEDEPLAIFGRQASDAVGALLGGWGIELRTASHPIEVDGATLSLVPHGRIQADRVLALPRLRGIELPGLPHDHDGLLPVDEHCRVEGVDDVYAAGDVTSFPLKQGGIAAQQADAAASAIAARFGAPVELEAFKPVLRGLLLTGDGARHMRSQVMGGHGEAEVSSQMLWWPEGKIAGRYITRFLAGRAPVPPKEPLRTDTIPVDVELPAR